MFPACVFQGQAASTFCPQSTTLDVNVFVDPLLLNISQFAIHTVDTALQSWKQVTHFNFKAPSSKKGQCFKIEGKMLNQGR